jgi:signal transduction histidine kinase
MKHSIRIRLVLTMVLVTSSIIFLLWFVNQAFLPEYYEKEKVKLLGRAYTEVAQIYANNEDDEKNTEEISLALEKLGASQSLNLYVFQLYYNQVGYYPEFLYPALDVFQQKEVFKQILEYAGQNSQDSEEDDDDDERERELLEETQEYKTYKAFDKRLNSYYIELFGAVDEETGIYVRSNYQSMLESITISNRFLTYIGILATVIGGIIVFVVSKSFTKPILELSKVADQVARLDFDCRYEVKRQDEIGTLGRSINTMADKLEKNISELKTANNELQKDIENKIQMENMRTEFLSNVSHELKTPIALIQGYAEGLQENINDDEENREFYCEVIMDEANKMNRMVKKLLSLNQIEFGKEPVSFERFDLVELVQSVLASTEILFQQKEARLTFEAKGPVFVWADEYMAEEVMTNYVSNALNHVAGEKNIIVSLKEMDTSVRICVYNDGETIPEEELDKIWEKFYKVDKARTREYGGSGIGLSIVKAIMHSLNQDFGVRNLENGVEFWFELDTKDE